MEFVENLQTSFDWNMASTALLPTVRERFGSKAEVAQVKVRSLNERVFACRLMISTGDKMPPISWPVVAKAFVHRKDLTRSFNLMRLLWENGFSYNAEDDIRIAEPLFMARDINLLFMEVVPGIKVRKFIKRGLDSTAYMRRFARTLAKLHQCEFAPNRKITLQNQLREKQREHCQLIASFPKLRKSIQSIVETSQNIAGNFVTDIHVPVHMDYNLGHVLIDGERSWLIDYDDIRHGDPAWDVGKVLTFTILNNENPAVSNGKELREAFKEEYFSIMDKTIAVRVPLYKAYYLLSRACKYQRTEEPSRLAKIEDLVKRAVSHVEQMSTA